MDNDSLTKYNSGNKTASPASPSLIFTTKGPLPPAVTDPDSDFVKEGL